MADILKQFVKHMDGVRKGAIADAAARAMAEHCDARVRAMQRIVSKIKTNAHDGQNGSTAYALDRLRQIEKLADTALEK